jgi:hypothetical protein
MLLIQKSSSDVTDSVQPSGGGIGGLALAALISQHSDDVLVDIYEAKPEISENGAAISIWKRSWQIAQDIGLDDELAKRGFPPPKDGEGGFPFYSMSPRMVTCLFLSSTRPGVQEI